jgi:hypothetical protein
MITPSRATDILSKLAAHQRITEQERADIEEYAERFKNPN